MVGVRVGYQRIGTINWTGGLERPRAAQYGGKYKFRFIGQFAYEFVGRSHDSADPFQV